MSFLEMLDVLNNELIRKGEDPIAFDHDCREGICGSCSLVIDGAPHGPEHETAVCQLHMRHYKDGDTVHVEPFRARSFPIIKDLFVNRAAFDKIIQAGGFISSNTGSAPEANGLPIGKVIADEAFASAACIGCGACVAACKNASASLFTSAKIRHLALLPQGDPERDQRVISMVDAMDQAGFGACSNTGACEAVCPKAIKLENIAFMNREYMKAILKRRKKISESAGGFG
jgi:succinate dehydrogenase / fumarate reductase iron-sulfur subunit